jgi:hypothetical protein
VNCLSVQFTDYQHDKWENVFKIRDVAGAMSHVDKK